ncbi:MAG TPA: glucoamylase family protein [Trueperaceae bacterium]
MTLPTGAGRSGWEAALLAPVGSPRGRAEAPRLRPPRVPRDLVKELAAREEQGPPSVGREWLLDNWPTVQRALRHVRTGLTPADLGPLPRYVEGPLAGRYRAAAMAEAALDLAGGEFSPEELRLVVHRVAAADGLTQAELWSLPNFLRLVSLKRLEATLAALLDPTPTAEANASVAAAVRSLVALERWNWLRFVEELSPVEAVLREDPAGVYRRMDFASRDHYRHAVARLAAAGGVPEHEVARRAVEAARSAGPDAPSEARHVGYYLVDAGTAELAEVLGLGRDHRLVRELRLPSHRAWLYAPSVALLSVALGVPVVAAAGAVSPWLAALAALLVVAPAVTSATALVHWVVARAVPPRFLPRFDPERGVPEGAETLLVVPAIVAGEDDVDALAARLELHHAADPDPRIWYALLTDFADADAETTPGDDELLAYLRRRVADLDARLTGGQERRFFVLHRRRLYNHGEGKWIGWERKRGKVEELVRLLTTGERGTYLDDPLGPELRGRLAFVLTLDADTTLPPGEATRLIACLAHPLNRPYVAADGRSLRRGYTFAQPRLDEHPESERATYLRLLMSGGAPIDLYHHRVSNAFMDLFGRGLFQGKALFDVRAFAATVLGRAPENALLSHDLLEGMLGGVAHVGDCQVLEREPRHHIAETVRLDRWTRGDWQVLPFLLRPGRLGLASASRVARWQATLPLVASLARPAEVALLALGWLAGVPTATSWTLFVLAFEAVPELPELLDRLLHLRYPGAARAGSTAVLRYLGRLAWRTTTLAHDAWVRVRAIVTTLYRLAVTRRHLLQWTTAAGAERALGSLTLAAAWRRMAVSPLLALALAVALPALSPGAVAGAAWVLALWTVAPWLAAVTGRSVPEQAYVPSRRQRARLRRLARQTWHFFERFVGPEDNWLPPDHFQEEPLATVAHRTSPTNVGLYLTSCVTAYDLGYLGLVGLTARLARAFETLGRLERVRGHFLNWYDTRTLRPLRPRYVSAVDSGNLLAALLTLRQALLELPGKRAWRRERWEGLLDSLGVAGDVVGAVDPGGRTVELLAALRSEVAAALDDEHRWPELLGTMRRRLAEVDESVLPLLRGTRRFRADELAALAEWRRRVVADAEAIDRDVALLLPWHRALAEAPTALRRAQEATEVGRTRDALSSLPVSVPLAELPAVYGRVRELLTELRSAAATGLGGLGQHGVVEWCDRLRRAVDAAEDLLRTTLETTAHLATLCEGFVAETELDFLFDDWRRVFRLGYRPDEDDLDEPAYDMLASESRLLSLVAIALGRVPTDHWVHLSRPFGGVGGRRALLSWSGTAFEYLMPPLLTRMPRWTLLHDACVNAVNAQRAHARARGTPWGVSESAFALVGADGEYQYRAFGVEDLALRRDVRDHVIAPYASVLALPVAPQAVLENLDALEAHGARGIYGLYDAVDFTPARLPLGKPAVVVRTYMAHHQAMVLNALGNAVAGADLPSRFHADARVAAVAPVLYERTPLAGPLERPEHARAGELPPGGRPVRVEPWHVVPRGRMPLAFPLGNGRYQLLLDDRGGGKAQWRGVALSRWRPDPVLPAGGQWLYLTDLDAGTTRPLLAPGAAAAAGFEVEVLPHVIRYRVRGDGLLVTVDAAVDPDHDVELWRVEVGELEGRPRRLALTRAAEPVLAPDGEDRRHPAFVKLFVEASEPAPGVVELRRRRRSPRDAEVVWRHAVVAPVGREPAVSIETDRERFLGRWGDYRLPAALRGPSPLGGVVTNPLDPVVALRAGLTVRAHGTSRLAFVAAAGRSRADTEAAMAYVGTLAAVDRALERAAERAGLELERLGLDSARWRTAQRLISSLVYQRPVRRDRGEPPRSGVGGLWRFGLSGDLPVVLLPLGEVHVEETVDLALAAQSYARGRGLAFDLVLLNDHDDAYDQPLAERIRRLVSARHVEGWLDRDGGVHVVRGRTLTDAERATLHAAARVVLEPGRPVDEQLAELADVPAPLPRLRPVRTPSPPLPADEGARRGRLEPGRLAFYNGHGGFEPGGTAYTVRVTPRQPTPAPWVNVLANERFGTLVSESGASTTWCLNSGENRLTPWANDPLVDPSGEALYLRDEETAAVWSPTPLPCPPSPDAEYAVTHEAAATTFRHASHGLDQAMSVHVPPDATVKVVELRLRDTTGRPRRVTATYAVDWVLGVDRVGSAPYLRCRLDTASNAVLVANPFHLEHPGRVAFLASDRAVHGVTADRHEFYGGGGRRRPAALTRIGLSGRVEGVAAPMTALQVHLDVPPHGEAVAVFALGQGDDDAQARDLARRYARREAGLVEARERWDELLGQLQVSTPDPALDLLVNRWLLHQVVACRLWGRTATYQSSGAIGFRDQLQDSLALLHTAPHLTRAQLLLAASRQFPEGDVLHWWHPPGARGVRTKITDDLVWLPYVTALYVEATGDEGVLDEEAPFLEGAPLADDEHERYAEYAPGRLSATLLEHGLRALDRASRTGPRGLPLIGTGDWNDGFDRVGAGGRGESVWLAWFLVAALRRFAPLCRLRDLHARADELEARADAFVTAIEERAWDWDRYIRAFYDDGSPLGARGQPECEIDVIAQAWSVLSGAAEPARARLSMATADERLVDDEHALVRLFTPPFTGRGADPGYIAAYPPGIRENGGQYTHGAVWAAWAFAELGDADRAHDLFRYLSPMRRAVTREDCALYRVEPYVVAADIGGHPPHVGRGGWTWYTGSAAWLWRFAVEGLLGVRRRADKLLIRPLMPRSWPGFTLRYRYGSSVYEVEVRAADDAVHTTVTVDGREAERGEVPLVDDGRVHRVEVALARAAAQAASATR